MACLGPCRRTPATAVLIREPIASIHACLTACLQLGRLHNTTMLSSTGIAPNNAKSSVGPRDGQLRKQTHVALRFTIKHSRIRPLFAEVVQSYYVSQRLKHDQRQATIYMRQERPAHVCLYSSKARLQPLYMLSNDSTVPTIRPYARFWKACSRLTGFHHLLRACRGFLQNQR